MRIALTDLETTSLSPTTGEIIEIGLIVFDSKTFEIFDTWEQKIRPLDIENANPKALAVNGYEESLWSEAIDIIPALEIFCEKTVGCTFMSYNINFDWSFMDFYLKKYGIENKFNYQKFCLMSLAFGRVPHDKVFSWSLKTICTYLRIVPEEKVHRGGNGARKGYEVYCKLMS